MAWLNGRAKYTQSCDSEKLLENVQDYRTQIKVTHIEQGINCWHLQLADGSAIYTRLLIGADGAQSFVREQAMIDLDVLDYKQSAVSCAIKTAQPHQHVARQIFCPLARWLICLWPVYSPKNMATGNQLYGLCQKIMPMNIRL